MNCLKNSAPVKFLRYKVPKVPIHYSWVVLAFIFRFAVGGGGSFHCLER